MDWGRRWTRSALWGGIALGVGTVLYALCSPSSVGCTTNLVVLTHSTVTARGCAAFSALAHAGVGLVVLGAVLLLGSFLLVIRSRRQVGTPESVAVTAVAPTESADRASLNASVAEHAVAATEPVGARSVEPGPRPAPPPPPTPRRPERVGPIAPGDDAGPVDAILLPPGWYGNPDNPAGQVQWWDGSKLVDRPR